MKEARSKLNKWTIWLIWDIDLFAIDCNKVNISNAEKMQYYFMHHFLNAMFFSSSSSSAHKQLVRTSSNCDHNVI